MNRLLAWLNRKFRVVATPEESEYLAWADEYIDHLNEHQNWHKRGYRLVCDRPGCKVNSAH